MQLLEHNKLQKNKLIFAAALPIITILLWFVPGIGTIMYSFDVITAELANKTFLYNETWNQFWALMNMREEKYIGALTVLLLSLWHIFNAKREKRIIAISQIILMWVYIQGGVILINFIFHDLTTTDRLSPSLVLKPFLRLSEYFGDSSIKDMSKRSLPSGHGFAMFYWIFFSYKFMPKKIWITTVIAGVFFCLPRFMSGAHWISDIIFAAMLAYVYAGSMIWTPMYSKSINYITIKIANLKAHLVKYCSRSSAG